MAIPSALEIGKVRGIPIRLHLTFLLVLPLFAYLMAEQYFAPENGAPSQLGWVAGGALAITLFVCVTLHELSHSITAQHFGITVRSITLLPIGGVSQMEEMPQEPRREFLVSAAGPLTNFVIAAPLLAYVAASGASIFPGGPLGRLPHPTEFGEFIRSAGIVNLTLGIFNLLLPAFPMDGGRILRSLLAARVGFLKATKYAASVGRALAVVMALFGLASGFGGLFLLLIAFFIYTGATEEERSVSVMATLGNLRVRDLMTASPVLLRPEDTLEQAFRVMVETKHVGFPVVEASGRVVGFLGLAEIARIDRVHFPVTPVRLAMRLDVPVIGPEALATEALRRMNAGSDEHLLVLDQGRLAGILTKTDVSRVVRILGVERGGEVA